MNFLVDTNVLLRSVQPNHPMYRNATNATSILLQQGESLHVVPQNLIEFWNVYTRPTQYNGLGYTVSEAATEIHRLKTYFRFLLDTPEIYQHWENLVITYGVMGVNVHDEKLVAAMVVHELTHILTFNIEDFRRYGEITVVHPTEIA